MLHGAATILLPHLRIKVSIHDEFASGTSFKARADALIMKSLTESL